MHLVILLLAALALFVFLTLKARRDPEKRKLFVLYVLIDLWLSGVFIYLLVGEKILPSTFVGLALIIAGTLIQQFRGKR